MICSRFHRRENRMRLYRIGDDDDDDVEDDCIAKQTPACEARRLRREWGQNSLGLGPPLDAVSLDDLHQNFTTGKNVQPTGSAG